MSLFTSGWTARALASLGPRPQARADHVPNDMTYRDDRDDRQLLTRLIPILQRWVDEFPSNRTLRKWENGKVGQKQMLDQRHRAIEWKPESVGATPSDVDHAGMLYRGQNPSKNPAALTGRLAN